MSNNFCHNEILRLPLDYHLKTISSQSEIISYKHSSKTNLTNYKIYFISPFTQEYNCMAQWH